jgi:hypothetical protein
MPTNRILKMKVVLGVILITQLGMAAGGQDVSEQGNPWVWVSIGKLKVKAEAVETHRQYI